MTQLPVARSHDIHTVMALGCLAACLGLAGCQEEIHSTPQHTSRGWGDSRQSDLTCNTIDRSPILSVFPADSSPDAGGRVFTGFVTHWSPGAPPFACDRLNRQVAQGLFRFDLSATRGRTPEPFRSALLEITRFDPLDEIAVVEARPWGLGFGTGWLGSPGTVHRQCTFTVSAAAQAWTPGDTQWARGPRTETRPLSDSRRATFVAPLDRGTVVLNVTSEIGALWRSGAASSGGGFLGFAIEPTGDEMDATSSSRCVGWFTVRLKTYHGND